MLEAACLLPVLTLLLLSAGYLHRLHSAAHAARASARRCAWLNAMAACEPDSVPPQCKGVVANAGASPEFRASGDTLQQQADAAGAEEVRGETLFDGIEDAPVVGEAFSALFGEGHTSTAQAPVGGTDLAGANAGELKRTHWLLCNHPGSSKDSVAAQLFELADPF